MKKFLLVLLLLLSLPAFAAEKESTFERVMRTGTIRCGYFTWAPFLIVDPNTHTFSGIYYDVIEEIGKQLSLKIDWVEETGQANPFEGLRTGRFDMFCGPITPTPDRAKQVAFSDAFFYIPYLAYTSAKDGRFNGKIEAINDPRVKIAVIDGEFANEIIKRNFPKASLLTLPALSDGSQVMLSVTTGKADIFLNDSAAAAVFMQKNPGSIKPVSQMPLRTLAAVLVLPQQDMAFKNMIDSVLDLITDNGFVDEVLGRYATPQSRFLSVARPYQVEK